MTTPPNLTPPDGSLPTRLHVPAPRRRSVVRAAAWAAPAVAVATAAPAYAQSVGSLDSVAWSDSETSLLSLRLLDGGGLLTAGALVTVPTEVTITNSGTAPLDNATVTVTVSRPAGINIPLGTARGFGVASFDGVDTLAADRTATYSTLPISGAAVGFPITTWTGTVATLPAGSPSAFPIVFGLAGTSSGLTVQALATFPVTVSVVADGVTRTASTSISVPVGAGLF